jgi:hypothetical protein
MRSLTKLLARLALVLVALAAFTAPALAAAPSNDAFANAKIVTIGFSETLDTTKATTEPIDAQALESCGAPAVSATVWYALQGDGSRVLVDLRGTDYVPGFAVVTGSPGNFTFVTCDAYYGAFDSLAGTTYYVVAFDSQEDGGGKGGNLQISFIESVLPKLTFSVDSNGTLDSNSGSATVSGSYNCSASAAGNEFTVFVDAKQGKVTGRGEFNGPCDGTTHSWAAVVAPESGKFKAGNLQTASFGIASNVDQGFAYTIKQNVTLPRDRK